MGHLKSIKMEKNVLVERKYLQVSFAVLGRF
jgi:hypothetical protein